MHANLPSFNKWLELQGKIAHWQTEALRILSEVFPEPRFEAVLSYKFNTDSDLLHCAKLLDFTSVYDTDRGKYTIAYEKSTKGLKIRENLLRNDHHLILESVHTVGCVLYYLEDLPAAKEMLQKATTGRITILGRENLDTLRSMFEQANAIMEMGNFDVAKELFKNVLETREKLMKLDHPDTLQSLEKYGVVMYEKEDLAKAEVMLQRALREMEKALRPDHPYTMTIVHNLALVSDEQSNSDAAIEMFRRVAKKNKRVLGLWHPDRITTVHNLADRLRQKGDLRAAEELYRKSISGGEKTFEAEHPTTLSSVESLADTLADKAEYWEAVMLYKQVFNVRQKILEAEHPHTLGTSVFSHSSLKIKKVLRAEHPDTLHSLYNLAYCTERLGDYHKAAELYKQVFNAREKILGAEHPDTLQSLHCLAYNISARGDYRKAEKLCKKALVERQKVLGVDHVNSLRTLRNLAETIYNQGPERYEDAEQRYRQAALIGEKLQGEEHLSVLSNMHQIAFLLVERDKHQKAEVLNRRVLRLREKVQSPLALPSLLSVNNLAWAIQKQDGARLKEAKVLHRRAYNGYKQVLGSESEETQKFLRHLRDILKLQHKYDESEDLARLLITTKE